MKLEPGMRRQLRIRERDLVTILKRQPRTRAEHTSHGAGAPSHAIGWRQNRFFSKVGCVGGFCQRIRSRDALLKRRNTSYGLTGRERRAWPWDGKVGGAKRLRESVEVSWNCNPIIVSSACKSLAQIYHCFSKCLESQSQQCNDDCAVGQGLANV